MIGGVAVLMLLSSCTSTGPIITGPVKTGVSGASTNGWVNLTFSECKFQSIPECFVGSQVEGGSSVKWQEWQKPNGSIYFMLVQDYWRGFLPNEPGVGNHLNQANVVPYSEQSVHYDGQQQISVAHPDVSLHPSFCSNQLPVPEPCTESSPYYFGHDYFNGTYDDAFIFYHSLAGASPIINWIEVYPLQGNPT